MAFGTTSNSKGQVLPDSLATKSDCDLDSISLQCNICLKFVGRSFPPDFIIDWRMDFKDIKTEMCTWLRQHLMTVHDEKEPLIRSSEHFLEYWGNNGSFSSSDVVAWLAANVIKPLSQHE